MCAGGRLVGKVNYRTSDRTQVHAEVELGEAMYPVLACGASHQVDSRTTLTAGLGKMTVGGDPELQVGTRRVIDSRGTFVGVDLAVVPSKAAGFAVEEDEEGNDALVLVRAGGCVCACVLAFVPAACVPARVEMCVSVSPSPQTLSPPPPPPPPPPILPPPRP